MGVPGFYGVHILKALAGKPGFVLERRMKVWVLRSDGDMVSVNGNVSALVQSGFVQVGECGLELTKKGREAIDVRPD